MQHQSSVIYICHLAIKALNTAGPVAVINVCTLFIICTIYFKENVESHQRHKGHIDL